MQRFIISLLVTVVLGLSLAAPAFAKSPMPERAINQILVEGTQRVDKSTVLSYMAVRPGDSFDAVRIDESLKRLFGTELFADIRMRRDGENLVVMVRENPIINRIAFEGNKRLKDDALEAEIQLRPRFVFTQRKVSEDVKRVLDIYRLSGRFGATVEPKIIKLEQNRVDLVFEIAEGDLTEVRRITFIGNKEFSDSSLRSEIQTKEAAFYRVFTSSDTYDPDRLNFDRELLRRHYLREGYADFEVLSAVAELDPDKKGFYITFTVNEGNRYHVGDINVATTVKDLNVEDLQSKVTFESGDWYDAEKLEETVDVFIEELGNLGYAFVEVNPDIDKNAEDRTLDVSFDLQEGPKVFVERIDIEGNVRTLDKVIRREFDLAEGDAFNASKLKRSRRNLRNLGFFENVEVDTEPGEEPDRTVIKARVAEQSTGELSFGAGFSTNESVLGNVRLRERNLLGRGQDLRLSTTISGRRQELDLGFTEPYFLDRKIAAGFDLFRVTLEEADDISFEQRRIGGALRLGYFINRDLRQSWRYTYDDTSIENVDSDASRFIRDQEGTFQTSEISQTLRYDVRDNRFNPTEGGYWSFTTALAGLGGNVKYYKLTADAGYYHPFFFEDVILGLKAETGFVDGLDDDVRISDRFFIGNNQVRGFQLAGLGPRDISTDDALGGNFYYSGSAEVSFPLGLPDELGIRGSVFLDAGTLTELDDTGTGIVDEDSLRVSTGIGISWSSPFGPIRIDFSEAIAKEDFDETESIKFNFGTSF